MKAILMSIKPKHVANILNKIKTLEIRKRFPGDYVGWVYIYVTKENDKHEICIYDNPIEHRTMCSRYHFLDNGEETRIALFNPRYIKGKVVARFWCDKVEEIKYHFGYYDMGEWTENYILENSCLSAEELDNYLQASKEYDEKKVSRVYGKAIHITKLEIFDKPKEIGEFSSKIEKTCICFNQFVAEGTRKIPLNRAPQSYMFIEVDL